MVFTWVALVILGFNAWSAFTNRRRKPDPVAKTTDPAASARTPLGVYGRRLSTFVLAGPLGGSVAILLTLSAFKLLQSLGIQTANAIVTTFFLTPLLWAAIATWVVIDNGTVRKVTLLFCCAAVRRGASWMGNIGRQCSTRSSKKLLPNSSREPYPATRRWASPAAAFLYVLTVSGTISVFNHELQRWEQPGAPEMASILSAGRGTRGPFHAGGRKNTDLSFFHSVADG